ncbi:SDR family NAD(P)-dependent oxidoreductase [Sphaerisporangium perillae]|uniref:SDR family NAD(P)-dependent oxidoreductase n=1 Tax=Sphaerisporangium perillae TaxID=2935860 RepID=UPI003556EC86
MALPSADVQHTGENGESRVRHGHGAPHPADGGHIVNIGSGGAHVHFPGLAMYTGTKAFLAAYSTAVHRELRRTGVHVSLLRCGDVHTEFFESMAARSSRIPREPRKIPAERVAATRLRPRTMAGLAARPGTTRPQYARPTDQGTPVTERPQGAKQTNLTGGARHRRPPRPR